jgi:MauM/NapG family ferredoxin protein
MFRLGLRNVVEPLVDYIEDRLDVALPVHRSMLRPPGALPERQFLEACYRCSNCVEACPATAIRPMVTKDLKLSQTPYIDPDLSACVVCDDLSCMRVCPSGALRLVQSPDLINMGLARMNLELCLRTEGQDCTVCVDKCPLGETAIQLGSEGRVTVKSDGCVGCGVCQFYCPTQPKAITVAPA